MCHIYGHCRQSLDVIMTPLPYFLIKNFINLRLRLLRMGDCVWIEVMTLSAILGRGIHDMMSANHCLSSQFVEMSALLTHYWLLVLLVCLTICDWLVCSEWSQCTPVLTVQLYTPADHTLTSLYTSHICVYEIRLLYNFTPLPLYQTHSEVQLIVYFILYIYVCPSSIGFPL